MEILSRNQGRLIDKVPKIEKIILFGSYSAGEQHFGSDVDLLFVVSERTKNDWENIYDALVDLSLDYEWSPIVITDERYNELVKEDTPFIRGIIERGITIFNK
ncbi:MAG: nucleotidyltransferase domain-containing protein [Promethearchaeota archaeon]